MKIDLHNLNNWQLRKLRRFLTGSMGDIAKKLNVHGSDVSRALAEPSNKDIAIREEAIRLAQENGFDINELLNA
jgi:DNA-binding MarR family transcriptional regulator